MPETDDELLQRIFSLLQEKVSEDPYSDDGKFAEQIRHLPVGLRAMAATHWVDVSLALDDIGWHFLNFGERGHVAEVDRGLQEIGLPQLAEWLREADSIMQPLLPRLAGGEDYGDVIDETGQSERLGDLSSKAWDLYDDETLPKVGDSVIYGAWVQYARKHPERVFGDIP